MKVTAIIGEPCVGKSTVMRAFMRTIPNANWVFANPKYVPLHVGYNHTIVIGNYTEPGHKYPGTDRMSMAAQPHVVKWLQERKHTLLKVFFEGDRLGNGKMFAALHAMGVDLEVVSLVVPPSTLAVRRAAERADQNPTFWKSRHTKHRNLIAELLALGIKRTTFNMNFGPRRVVDYLRSERL